MKISVHFDEAKTAALIDMMAQNADRAAHMKPAMNAILGEYLEGQRALFDSQGASASPPWPELTAGSKLVKERGGFEGLEVKSGTLRGSLTHPKGAAKYAASYATDTAVFLGTTDPIAHNQVYGTSVRTTKGKNGKKPANRGALPPREMARVPRSLIARAFVIMSNWLDTGSVGAGMSGPE